VEYLREGNSIVTGKKSGNEAADCAPCANSELTLKERMAKLDDMELIDGNESIGEETNDDRSIE
jgi:hypothetical protein